MSIISKTEKESTADIIDVKLADKAKKIKADPENYDISDLRDICQLNQIRDNLNTSQ